MSKGLKVVFAVFTQHCIQSNVTHLAHVRGGPLYKVASRPSKIYCNIFTHNFLNIQLIFNSKKSFGKLSMLKHVEGV